ncbi:PstS family phosphate ABC transporter substrate-binding protein [Sorangium sp. So ce1153]|uniref:PstS family phosphate ABC transporter substrate-binding protein n=1 Tax=Sorangium sp. So ce1153 TaxID=3133333 RepID=UPI003F629D17
MSMNTTGNLVLSALSVLGLAACAVSSTDEAEVLDESQEALIAPNGGFYGSDTLFNAITDALTRVSPPPGTITYLGTGSGKGEQCLRGTGAAPCNAKVQTIAPMSRDLAASCQVGEKSNRVALDGIAVLTKSTQAASNLTSTDVADAFCGTGLDGSGKRNGSVCNDDLWSEIVSGASNPSNAIQLYRRDDLSGTTEVFKEKNNCSAFCPSVKIVVDDLTAGPRLSTDAAGTSSLVSGGTCTASDSVTDCMGKIAAANNDRLVYAGLDAANASNKKLSIDSVAPTTANIRLLISSPGTAYKYARFLYLNEGNGTRATPETNFINWIISNKANFEDALTDAGFISCKDPTLPGYLPLACGSTGTTCPRNSSL